MKSLLITLLIFGGLFLAYDYFLALPHQRIVFQKGPAPEVVEQPKTPEETSTEETGSSAPKSTAPKKDKNKDKTATTTPGSATPATATTPDATAPTTATATPAPKPGEFVPPHFETIEELSGNWLKLPKSAFGRIVKLAKPVTLRTTFGESKIPAGQSMLTIGEENGQLIVAPSAESAARGLVNMDDTDFKAQLIDNYEGWKVDRVVYLKALFERKKRLAPPPVSASFDHTQVDNDGKPIRSADGTYPILLAKMRSGDPVEITPQNITRWSEVESATVNGAPGYTIEVSYTAKTPFGIQNADTIAQIQNGKVTAWIYKGSGEPVP